MSKKEKQPTQVEKVVEQPQTFSSAPQIQIIDGKLVLNQDSITIRQQVVNFEKDYERVDEKETKRITSATYSRFKKTPKWSREETELFFSGVQQFGCDFSYISKLFPHRDRRQIRNKFKKEEKENRSRIESCLRNRKPIDKVLFEKMTKLGEEKKKEFGKEKKEEKKEGEEEEKEEKDEWKSIEEEGQPQKREVIDEGEYNEPYIVNENETIEEGGGDDDDEEFY